MYAATFKREPFSAATSGRMQSIYTSVVNVTKVSDSGMAPSKPMRIFQVVLNVDDLNISAICYSNGVARLHFGLFNHRLTHLSQSGYWKVNLRPLQHRIRIPFSPRVLTRGRSDTGGGGGGGAELPSAVPRSAEQVREGSLRAEAFTAGLRAPIQRAHCGLEHRAG